MSGAGRLLLCRVDELIDGQVHLLPNPVAGDPATVLVLRTGDDVSGYQNRCPHFGVPLAQRQEHLIFVPHKSLSCNVHYARFRWHDGVCETGDCLGEALTPLHLVVDQGAVWLGEA